MKMIFLLLIVIAFITSCSHSGSAVSKQLATSDSLIINFTVIPSGSVIKSVTTTEEKAIEKLSHFVDGKSAGEFNCGYNGNLLFFSKGKMVSNVSFNYTEDNCRHFLLSVDGKKVNTKMNNEAADFLKSLAEGKDWY